MSGGERLRGAVCGLAAAALFGVSAPLAKLLLPGFGPISLAATLYLGAGLGLTGYRLVFARGRPSAEAKLRAGDYGWLVGIVLAGGVVGPVLMLLGLERVSAVAGSLLLNLEGPFTIAVAVLVFGEHLGGRELTAAAIILGGAGLLAYGPGELGGELAGAAAIAGACLSWAIDNNLTQRLSLRDPPALVQVKTLGAGALMLLVALAVGQPFPAASHLAAALVLGAMSYGLSIVLDTYALRLLGAAREAAFFATAPFVGALVAVAVLGEHPRGMDAAGAAAMIAGVALLIRARHGHVHTHEALEHEHLHVHDAHHQHAHEGPGPVTEPHSHPHVHAPLTHDHPHVSDLHHRHRH